MKDSMILFLYGADTYRSRSHMHKMMAKFRQDRDPESLNINRLDCETQEASVLWEHIKASPFLAEKRMVVIENPISCKDDSFRKELLVKMEENTLPQSTVLLCWESGTTFKKKEQKDVLLRLSQEKYSQCFDILVGSKLEAWIDVEIRERGGHADREAIQYIANNIGYDMWGLNSLLEQLIAYTKEYREESPHSDSKGITVQTVEFFLGQRADDSIFSLIDAIVAKQPKKVFAMIEEQYKGGEDPQFIFAMLVRQTRIMLQLRDLLDRGEMNNADVIAKNLQLHPFVVKKTLSSVNKYTMEALKTLHESLCRMDIDIKTGQIDARLMLDVLVGKLVSV